MQHRTHLRGTPSDATSSSSPDPSTAPRWLTVEAAAQFLDLTVVTLRRTLERNARRGPDGSIEAHVDGVRARKFNRRWRVWLDATWTAPIART